MLKIISELIIPVVLLIIPLYGLIKHVKVYEVFVDGAKDGINTMTKIFPALLAMLVAVGVLRSSGALDGFAKLIEPFTSRIGMPSEVIPLALIRPLSGSGALGIATELIKSKGPDSTFYSLTTGVVSCCCNIQYTLVLFFLADAQSRNLPGIASPICSF